MMKKSLILLVILLLGFSFVIGVGIESVDRLSPGENSDTDIPEVPDTGCVRDSDCSPYACDDQISSNSGEYACYDWCRSDVQCYNGMCIITNGVGVCSPVTSHDNNYNCDSDDGCEPYACDFSSVGGTLGNCYEDCTDDSQCADGYGCKYDENNNLDSCYLSCNNNFDCKSDYACSDDSTCLIDTNNNNIADVDENCNTDDDCELGYVCLNNNICSTDCIASNSGTNCADDYACSSTNVCLIDTDNNGVADVDEFSDCSDGIDNNRNELIDLNDPGCVSANDNYEDYGCNDGIDNDGDGYVDYGNRIILAGTDSSGIKIKENFMCNSENELWIPWYIRDYINDEGYLSGLIAGEDCEEQCSLIQDYYDGTLTYENYVYTVSCTYYSGDPSCSCTRDNYEDNSNSEEIDCGVSTNTETGDVGCTSNDDCSDGYTCDFKNGVCYDYCNSQVQCKLYYACDAQGDADGSCRTFCGLLVSQCSDGVDNDYVEGVLSDGTDYPDDPECRSKLDTDESLDPQCADGIDNDYFAKETTTPSDGIDYPNDPQCLSPEDDSEGIVLAAAPEVSGGFFSRILDFILFWE